MTSATAPAPASRPSPKPARTLRRTELGQYPSGGQRFFCLGIVVLATIVLYYQFYLAGAVAAGTNGQNGILLDTHMSFVFYVNIAVVGYVLGALASFVSGVADKYGRVNIVTGGLFVVGLLCLVGIPLTDTSKWGFAVVYAAVGFVEGIILVATPALIRDFSPQLGRASAMGFWTLGPVLGSLVVSVQVSSASNTYPWAHHYAISGIVGLVVAVLSLVFLRELSPELRDQVMVSSRDRALVEARAAGIDVEASLKHPFRQMLKPDIVLSAFSISVFLIIYYVAVGFFPAYFETVFGFTQSKANSLGNYIWAFDAGALLLIGYLSDKIRVRKPFMVVGAIGAIVMTVIFALRATHPDTSFTAFAIILSLLAVFLGVAYAPWMASFTETVEKRNPALTATGLAVWGLVIRIVIAVSVFIVPLIVTTVSTLVEKGPVAQQLAVKYSSQLATAAKLDPTTSAALAANPNDTTAGIKAISEITGISVNNVTTVATLSVTSSSQLATAQALDASTAAALLQNPNNATAGAKAVGEIVSKFKISEAKAVARLQALAKVPASSLALAGQYGTQIGAATTQLQALGAIPKSDLAILQDAQSAAEASPKQWQHYFWIAVGGEVVFIPLIFLLTGAWSPKRAKREEQEHETMVEAELQKLNA